MGWLFDWLKKKNTGHMFNIKLEEKSYKKISFKYFLWYNDGDDIIALCIKLPQMIGYGKCFDSKKTVSFKVSDKKLVKKLY